MIQLRDILLIVSISAATPLVFANNTDFFSVPYFGVEAIQTNQNYKAGFGQDVFAKNTMNYSIFAGFKFYKFLGIEAGYEAQPKATKMTQLSAGQVFPGADDPILAGEEFFTNSVISGSHPYVGIFAELDQKYKFWFNQVKYQLMLAAAFSNIKASFTSLIYNEPYTGTSYSDYSGSKVVPMVKLSATSNFANNLGLRFSINYYNFASMQLEHSVKLKDTFGVGLGVTYSFFRNPNQYSCCQDK